jgi:hypothetical protein
VHDGAAPAFCDADVGGVVVQAFEFEQQGAAASARWGTVMPAASSTARA